MRINLGAVARVALLVTVAAIVGPSPGQAGGGGDDDDWVRTTGDILQIALPVLGGGSTFFTNPESGKRWDRDGTKQFAWAYGASWTTTYGLNLIFSKARPNGDNRTSFPSGHTMSAFAGAAFIDGRYGRTFGIPAYALAVFTGYSRVHSGWHYRDDVLAGASIAMMYSWHFVSPQPGKISLLPTVSGQGLGMTLSVGGTGRDLDQEAEAEPRGSGYEFAFGPAFLISNQAASLGDGGTVFELGGLEGNNDPTTTASVTISLRAGAKGRVRLGWGPFEAKDRGAFSEDVVFGGETYAAGEPVESQWRYYDARGLYERVMLDSRDWGVSCGAGIGLAYSYAALAAADTSRSSLVDDTVVYPYLMLGTNYRFSDRLSLGVSGAGITWGNEWLLDAKLTLCWRVARAWDFSIGYMYFTRQIETDTFYNKVRYSIPGFAMTRYW